MVKKILEDLKNHSLRELKILENKISLTNSNVELERLNNVKEIVVKTLNVFDSVDVKSYDEIIIAFKMLNRLIRMLPLTEITENSEEWVFVDENTTRSNRCPSVFKYKDEVYDALFYVFIDKDNKYVYDDRSIKQVKLPYLPPDESIVVYD